MPATVKAATEDYRLEADPVRSFADECLYIGSDESQNRTDIYSRFRLWRELLLGRWSPGGHT